jgi:hypothetical protein
VVESGRKKAAAAGKKGTRDERGRGNGKKREQERRRQEAGKKGRGTERGRGAEGKGNRKEGDRRQERQIEKTRFYPQNPRHPRSILLQVEK